MSNSFQTKDCLQSKKCFRSSHDLTVY